MAVVGPKVDLTYEYEVVINVITIGLLAYPQHLGDDTSVLQDIASGKHPFSKVSMVSA